MHSILDVLIWKVVQFIRTRIPCRKSYLFSIKRDLERTMYSQELHVFYLEFCFPMFAFISDLVFCVAELRFKNTILIFFWPYSDFTIHF